MTPSNSGSTLSVVIPVFNEEKNIAETLRRVSAYFSLKKFRWEVLVSDDGSTDTTAEMVRKFANENPQHTVRLVSSSPNHGKGFATRQGMLAASGRYILFTDADLSAPIKETDKLIQSLENGADVAIGSRGVHAKDCDVQQSLKRRFSGRVFNWLVRALVLPDVRDSQCGFKCFTRETAQKLFSDQKLDGFCFDVEVLYLAKRAGLKVAEVPVMWSEGRESKIRLVRDSLRMFKDLLLIKKIHAS